MKGVFFGILALFISGLQLQAQDNYALPPYEFSGYVKDVQTVFVPEEMKENWLSDNAIHNRLKFTYYPTSWLTLDIQARNRFIYGDFVKLFPDYTQYALNQDYYADLDWVWFENESAVGISELDRLNAQLVKGKWELTLGRQRINWGMNLVWNPNDVFNTFSYFNFEYEERPGTDAARIKYYGSLTSSAELVYQAGDSIEKMAMAGLYRFNKWGYDFQFLGGFMGNDYLAGFGYSGHIGGAAFRGEMTWFQPRKSIGDTTGIVVASLSGDYTFENNLYLHGGFLFNSNGKSGKAGGIGIFTTGELSPKTLSRGKVNLFGQITYNITPLVKGGVSTIMNPQDLSAFVSPSIDVSISDNFQLSGIGQLFFGQNDTEFGKIGQIGYLRFKYSF
ncbi:hypothetical protein [Salinivirga cyanobacteriivorans]